MKKLFSVLILSLLALLMGLSLASAQVAELPSGFSLSTLTDSLQKEGIYITTNRRATMITSVLRVGDDSLITDQIPTCCITFDPSVQDDILEKRLDQALKRIEELERLLKQHLEKP